LLDLKLLIFLPVWIAARNVHQPKKVFLVSCIRLFICLGVEANFGAFRVGTWTTDGELWSVLPNCLFNSGGILEDYMNIFFIGLFVWPMINFFLNFLVACLIGWYLSPFGCNWLHFYFQSRCNLLYYSGSKEKKKVVENSYNHKIQTSSFGHHICWPVGWKMKEKRTGKQIVIGILYIWFLFPVQERSLKIPSGHANGWFTIWKPRTVWS
jgi:hypothetical protein